MKIVQLIVTLIAICAISGSFFYHSQGYDSEVVRSYQAPVGNLTAHREEPLLVPFKYPDRPAVGVLLYAADLVSAKTQLDVTVIDANNTVVARKISQHTAYPRSGDPALSLFLSFSKKIHAGQELQLVIIPQKDTRVSFTANIQEGEHTKPLLVFATLHVVPPTFAVQQGVLIGTALALFCVALYLLRGTKLFVQWAFAGLGICIFSLCASLPYVYHPGALGINDWDYRYSLAHIYQTTIRTYHQLPLWNPYICGGTAALGDPEFALFTPSFALQYLFGVEAGTGYALVLCFIVTGIGVLILARRLVLPPMPAMLSAIVVLFSSTLFLKATEGHVTIIFAFMWVPWILWAWIEKRIFLCALFLMFALLQGGIYVLSYSAISLVGVILLHPRRKEAIRNSCKVALWAIGLSSFQLIPTLYWLRAYPDKLFVGSAYTYDRLSDILFGRYLDHTFILRNQISDWHEYGAYIGYGVALLVLFGVSYVSSRKVVRVLTLGMVVALIVSMLGPVFEHVLWHLPYLPRSNISRLVLFSLLCAALLAGFGMKRLFSVFQKLPAIPLIIAGFICIDLLSLAYPIADQAFILPRVEHPLPLAPYPLSYVSEAHMVRKQGIDFPRAYEATLRGYGTSSFCSVIGPQSAVVEQTIQHPHPLYITSQPDVDTALLYWSPNFIAMSVTGSEPTDIAVNMNYAPGWYAVGGDILRDHALLTVRVPSGMNRVELRYIPPGSIVGLCITFVTLVWAWKKMRGGQKGSPMPNNGRKVRG